MKLLEPLTFANGVLSRNRAALAPMTNHQSNEDGSLANPELRWLEERADGGFGIIITCAAHVSRGGKGWPGELGIFSDDLMEGLSQLASSLRSRGSLPMVQLYHGGYRSPSELIGGPPRGPSSYERYGAVPLTDAEILAIIEDFVAAAVRAEKAGFSGIELHGAHGYLLTQFLSVVYNKRTDCWGGSLENRARLLRMVTSAIRARVSPSFVVGVRLSPEDNRAARGLDLDESVQVGRWLADDGADFLHLSLWNWRANSIKRPNMHVIPVFRQAIPSAVRIIAAGDVWTGADAAAVLALGADGVAVGRAAILDANWPLIVSDDAAELTVPPVPSDRLAAKGLTPYFIEQLRGYRDPMLVSRDS